MQCVFFVFMPRLWHETVDEHRREVHEAILDATAALVAEHGLRAVTMSQVAASAGIGRATLYKYFPGVEAILIAWHERQVREHLSHLAAVREQAGDAVGQLQAVLHAYALSCFEHHGSELAAQLHRGRHVGRARQQLEGFVREILREGVATGDIRADVPADELATYCLNAAASAEGLRSKAAVRRLVTVTLSGVKKTPDSAAATDRLA